MKTWIVGAGAALALSSSGCRAEVVTGYEGHVGSSTGAHGNTSAGSSTGGFGGSTTARAAVSSSTGSGNGVSTGTGTGNSSSGSSTGTSSGGSTTGAPGCTVDGQLYAPLSANPDDPALCCNPAVSSGWTPRFVKAMSYPVGSSTVDGPYGGLVTDLNGDGLADVVLVATASQAQTWIYLSEDGGFSLQTYADEFNTGAAEGVAFGDLNRDGIPDLVMTTSGAILFRLGRGGGAFAAVEGGTGTARGNPSTPVILDVNGDGWPDAITTGDGLMVVYLNDAGHDLSFGSVITEDTSGTLLVLADVNGDGLPDLVYQDSVGSLAWAENTGFGIDAGGYLWWPSIAPNLPANLQGVFGLISLPPDAFGAGDNGDGLAFTYSPLPYFGFCQLVNLDDSQGPCQQGQSFDIPNGALALADAIDGDGRPQLLVGGSRNGESWIEFGQVLGGDGMGSQATPGSFYETIAAGDLNGDGFTDLIIFRAGAWEGWVNTCGPGAARTLAGSGNP